MISTIQNEFNAERISESSHKNDYKLSLSDVG